MFVKLEVNGISGKFVLMNPRHILSIWADDDYSGACVVVFLGRGPDPDAPPVVRSASFKITPEVFSLLAGDRDPFGRG